MKGEAAFLWCNFLSQMAFFAISYMYIDLFALQHISDRPGILQPYMRAQGPNAQCMDYHDLSAKLYSLTLLRVHTLYLSLVHGLQPQEWYQTNHSLKNDLIGSRAGIIPNTLQSWGAHSAIWATVLQLWCHIFLLPFLGAGDIGFNFSCGYYQACGFGGSEVVNVTTLPIL